MEMHLENSAGNSDITLAEHDSIDNVNLKNKLQVALLQYSLNGIEPKPNCCRQNRNFVLNETNSYKTTCSSEKYHLIII